MLKFISMQSCVTKCCTRVLNWHLGLSCRGNGFVTDTNIIQKYGLSDPNYFFRQLLSKPYVDKVCCGFTTLLYGIDRHQWQTLIKCTLATVHCRTVPNFIWLCCAGHLLSSSLSSKHHQSKLPGGCTLAAELNCVWISANTWLLQCWHVHHVSCGSRGNWVLHDRQW